MTTAFTKLFQVPVFMLGFAAACTLWIFIAMLAFGDLGEGLTARAQVDEEAAATEGKQLLTFARERVRGSLRPDGTTPVVLAGDESMPGCEFPWATLEGDHYLLVNAVIPAEGGTVEIVAIPLANQYPVLRLRFHPAGTDDGELFESWVP